MAKQLIFQETLGLPAPSEYIPSILFGYSITKKLDGIRGAGTTGWWGERVLKGYGMCDERLLPYGSVKSEEEVPKIAISAEAYRSGYQHRSFAYQRLYTLNDVRRTLAHPVVVITLTDADGRSWPIPPFPQLCFDLFESARTANKGHLPVPGPGEKAIAGHSVVVEGYNDNLRELRFWNNWGPGWGDKGYGYLPYEYFNRKLINEVWVPLFPREAKVLGTRYDDLFFRDTDHQRIRLRATQLPALSAGRPRFWVFDLYDSDFKLAGWAHCSVYADRDTLEIEELFVMPDYRRRSLGRRLLAQLEGLGKFSMVSKLVGWVHRQDVSFGRDQIVRPFFESNGFKMTPDFVRFRDSRWCVEKFLSI